MSDFLLVLIVIFLLFGLFRRYIFFFIMTAISRTLFKEMTRMQQKQQEKFRRNSEDNSGKMNSDANRKGNQNNEGGEYVDFEEIKD